MKYIITLIVCSLASCAPDAGDWNTPDPNDGVITPGEGFDMHHHASVPSGATPRPMTDRQMRELTKPAQRVRFSGMFSFGVGTRL